MSILRSYSTNWVVLVAVAVVVVLVFLENAPTGVNALASSGGGFGGFGTNHNPKASTRRQKGKGKKSIAAATPTPTTTKKQKQKPPCHYTPDESPTIQRLWHHLIEVEECEGLETLEVGFDQQQQQQRQQQLRGLYTTQDIQKGEYICAIPFVSALRLEETFFPDDEAQDELQLSAARMANAKRFLEESSSTNPTTFTATTSTAITANNNNSNSNYQHYLDCLPSSVDDPNFTPTPDFWTVDEIQDLQVPLLVQDLLDRKDQIVEETAKVKAAAGAAAAQAIACDKEDISIIPSDELVLQHALWTVRTRAFTTLKKAIDLDAREGLLQRTVLIPGLDLLNHKSRPDSNAALEVVETKEYIESFFALVAKRAISAGEELTICYGTGEETSLELYSKYGFWPDDNGANDLRCLEEWETTWNTTLEQDQDELASLVVVVVGADGTTDPRRSILEFRIRLKELQLQQQKLAVASDMASSI